jgi:hypothetical protein
LLVLAIDCAEELGAVGAGDYNGDGTSDSRFQNASGEALICLG